MISIEEYPEFVRQRLRPVYLPADTFLVGRKNSGKNSPIALGSMGEFYIALLLRE